MPLQCEAHDFSLVPLDSLSTQSFKNNLKWDAVQHYGMEALSQTWDMHWSASFAMPPSVPVPFHQTWTYSHAPIIPHGCDMEISIA